jgi:hypothetical protein
MYKSDYFTVLVKGQPIKEYLKDGKYYVEGRKGSDYELRYHNTSGVRKKVVFSVDGLNIMSGDKDWTKGYVVEPYQIVTIPGWRKDGDNVAKFVFSSVPKSYNQHNDAGDRNNVGVIGAMTFLEKSKPLSQPIIYNWNNHYHYPQDYPWYSPLYHGNLGGAAGDNINVNNVTTSLIGGAVGGGVSSSLNNSFAQASYTSSDASLIASNSIGTGWGENKTFQTTMVDYEFGTKVFTTMLLYYDSREGLQARGIVDLAPVVVPQAFPGFDFGCPAPK